MSDLSEPDVIFTLNRDTAMLLKIVALTWLLVPAVGGANAQQPEGIAERLARIASAKPENVSRFLDRTGAVTKAVNKQQLKEYSLALGTAIGRKNADINDPGFFNAWLAFSTNDAIFVDGTFSIDALRSHIRRIQQIPAKTLREYCGVFANVVSSTISYAPFASEMVFFDGLFSGDVLQEERLAQRVARTKAIGPSTCKQWRTVFGKEASCLELALKVVEIDELFAADTFQGSVFEASLPAAKLLLSKQ